MDYFQYPYINVSSDTFLILHSVHDMDINVLEMAITFCQHSPVLYIIFIFLYIKHSLVNCRQSRMLVEVCVGIKCCTVSSCKTIVYGMPLPWAVEPRSRLNPPPIVTAVSVLLFWPGKLLGEDRNLTIFDIVRRKLADIVRWGTIWRGLSLDGDLL